VATTIQILVLNGAPYLHALEAHHAAMELVPAPRDPNGHVLEAAVLTAVTMIQAASHHVLMSVHTLDKMNA